MSITLVLVIITSLISYQALSDASLLYRLQHSPYQEAQRGEHYRFITSGFVHGSFPHLLINMFVFWQFGQIVESYFLQIFGELMGRINYILLYFLTIIVADLPTFFKHRNNPSFASVGASGAVSGVLFAFILFNPWSTLLLFFIIPCPAIVAAVLYLVYSSWASRNQNDRIDHDAHFYGAVFGMLFTILLKPSVFNIFLQELIEGFPL